MDAWFFAGSENNSLYIYYKGLSKQLLTYKFDTVRSVLVSLCCKLSFLCGVNVFAKPFHFSLIFQAFMSILTVSFHRNLGLHLGRFPSIFISATALMPSVSSLILMWLNHCTLVIFGSSAWHNELWFFPQEKEKKDDDDANEFVSAVCWRPVSNLLDVLFLCSFR